LRSLRNQGRGLQGQRFAQVKTGYNYRLSELACALGRVQLGRLKEMLALRRNAAERYDALLQDTPGLEVPALSLPCRNVSWFVYVVRLPEDTDRDRVQAALAQRGIATGSYFAPIHMQTGQPSTQRATLTLTESIARRTLALPFFNRIAPDQQRQVAAALQEALRAEN
jgi:perosamine synthetase